MQRLSFLAIVLACPVFAAEPVNFSRDVLPILSDNCFQCHGPDAKALKADLRLDIESEALRKESPVIVPGKSKDSLVIQRIISKDTSEVMPPPKSNKKLTPAQIDTLKRWIDDGAKWGKHWAFEPPVKAKLPTNDKNAIDAFIKARLIKEGLKQSPQANKETLIRRVTLDLTGIPPTIDEVNAFLADKSADAYEKLVDQLLASPRYGERMAWEWVEAGRYSDTNGYQGDSERTMWPWRDWVIKAFNDNMPYDQFTIQQIAGDMLDPQPDGRKLATAFLRNHMINGEGGRIAEESRVDYVMDMTETIGTVWLGLTLNCCRCHNHKFDPVSQAEYYGMFAFFNQTAVDGSGRSGQTAPVIEVSGPTESKALNAANKTVTDAGKKVDEFELTFFPREKGKLSSDSPKAAKLQKEYLDPLRQPAEKRSAVQIAALIKFFAKDADYVAALKPLETALTKRDATREGIVKVMVMEEGKKSRDTFILDKGLYNKPTTKVTAHVPAAVGGNAKTRLDLARWLVAKENPLSARVTVNRLWQQFFGIGIVKTTNDFGVQGERPVHPELLDWLAVEFVESGWDMKKFMKLMVTSETYKQSSNATKALLDRDPENRLLARGVRHRLPSWMIRDQALAISGLYVEKLGGPSVKPYQPTGIWEEATFGTKKYTQDTGEKLYRRSLYTYWRRIVGPTMFFDVASRQTCTVKVARTNTPIHALVTLNDITYVEASRAFAERVMSVEGNDEAKITYAYQRAIVRKPNEDEMKVLTSALSRLREQYKDEKLAKQILSVGESKRNDKLPLSEHAAWAALCGLILNLDETLSKE